MHIVDTALAKRHQSGNPVRVALVGAGYMGRGIALQIVTCMTGMKLVAIANRTRAEAARAYREAGIAAPRDVETVAQLQDAIRQGQFAITDNPLLLCEAEGIDAVIEATGEVEFASKIVMHAIKNHKHIILMDAELDATIGPILKVYADRAGVVITNTDGDEPGVAMNLFRFVKTIGYQPVLAGNIKGFIDPYRTPATQQAFAAKVNQKPKMITSFADGTKLAMETTLLANATGLQVGKRGMYGHRCAHVKDLLTFFSADQLLERGLVDYALGAEPGTGAFVVGYNEQPILQQYMSYFKMGDGPLYLFYTPYHLPHLQLALTAARAVLFHDPTIAPLGAPVCDVITLAKRDLRAGEILDGIGGFTCYGTIENSRVCRADNLLPMGLSEGCRVKNDLARDQAITYADVSLPAGRLADQLRAEQDAYFANVVKSS
ncbi:MAG: NAD(P)-dependent oxidoreductase [Chloroflexi bacterium]|nr:NAD(P)-dependent oxidoreductase [Chloroflexota bacterium]